ncbi:sensory histidine kinase in two-component regulatory system [Cupriavidus taiwanensis]|uniref:histidine kinase n=1 Tax=Cupriavidus taiwanensis TaxID=164546 RepID=A0A375CGF4_9BURK|nr:ATP-binding protein [Cupriavidus taiwanensis]SOY69218.1 sensory histidine kinase in two-component regulatory system [Cupriavidus taiwanensis]
MRLLPRSLLARNIALLVALVAVTQACSLSVLLHFVQRPRIERAAMVFSDYVKTLDAVLAAMPAQAGAAAAGRLGAQRQEPAHAAPAPAPDALHLMRTWQRDVFMQALQRRLPDTPVRWQSGQSGQRNGEKLWIRLHVGGTPQWIALPMSEDARAGGIGTALALSLALALLAALTGYLIQLHLNRPLQELAQAARRIRAGETPPALPTDGPTEIAQVSSAFNQMMQALQQAEQTRALMLAGVSHDIRTPLTKLRLAMAMAIPRGADDAFVASAEGYLDHIETILQQFMDYAGSGEKELPQPGDLNALVGQLVSDFAGLGHAFELSLAELPRVPYRPVSLMRLLMNLMQNAVVYGKSGFSVRTWRDAACAYVAVGDRGTGITPQALEQLKAPFSRGDNARGHAGGTGLGLAIVERIARLHGGSLQFRARDGGGLEAVVALPLQSPAA